MTVPAAIPNMELVNRVLEKIENDQEHWDQNTWATMRNYDNEQKSFCNTSHCFGGWALEMMGRLGYNAKSGDVWPIDRNGNVSMRYSVVAADVLGFNEYLADLIFNHFTSDFQPFRKYVYDMIEEFGALTIVEAARKLHAE